MKKLLFVFCFLASGVATARAAGPNQFAYQGNLLDPSGEPIPDGTYQTIFRTWDVETGFAQENQVAFVVKDIEVKDGFFTSVFGGGFANQFLTRDQLWLEVVVDLDRPQDGFQGDEIFGPRQLITTAPFAQRATQADNASNANNLGGAPRTQFLENGARQIETVGDNGNTNVLLTDVSGSPNNGAVGVFNPEGVERGSFLVSSQDSGTMALRGPDGNLKVGLFSSFDSGAMELFGPDGILNLEAFADNDRGQLFLRGNDDDLLVELEASENDTGVLVLAGPNGATNVLLANTGSTLNNGAVAVADGNGTFLAGIQVTSSGQGVVFADEKIGFGAFPNDANRKIVYRTLDGPEVAVYLRGVVALREGRGRIELPDHFLAVANPKTITVQLTPASLDSLGVAVAGIGAEAVRIGELQGGTGSYDVHYMVQAVRRGYENAPTVLNGEEFRQRFGLEIPQRPARRAPRTVDSLRP